ncbi:hypothetical protein LJC33_01855 [Eubacteriales bacterium OttesenSCG-928-N13]|nr:hypothetical protein [Eubacteriales bacterium OttesenSCG-928-N13]
MEQIINDTGVETNGQRFIRRVYFERNTLEVIYFYSMSGQFHEMEVEQEWEEVPELQANTHRKQDIDVLQWHQPDPEVEALCERAAWLGVRRTAANASGYELYDATGELPEAIDPDSEASQILACLQSGAAIPDSLPPSQRAQLRAYLGAVDTLRASLSKQQLAEVETELQAREAEEIDDRAEQKTVPYFWRETQ